MTRATATSESAIVFITPIIDLIEGACATNERLVYNIDMSRSKNVQKSSNRIVIGYVRVSTDGQTESGASLTSQTEAIRAECLRNSWTLLEIVEDAGISGKSLVRPGLQTVLERLRTGEANVLMAAKLDRLSRSTRDVCEIGDMAQHYGYDLCLLDARIDTTTPHGRAQLSMMATFAQLERELIGVRTREALAVKKSQGVQLGRPKTVGGNVVREILKLRKGGLTLRAIAATLNETGVPTGQGGKIWHPTTIKAILDRETVAA